MINSISGPFDTNIPVLVPTLVLMLRSASFCHDDADNDPYFNHEVLVHITPYVYRMNLGEMADYEGLFDPWILEINPRWGYLNVLSRVVSDLVAQGKVPLEVVDYNGDLTEIYRRV